MGKFGTLGVIIRVTTANRDLDTIQLLFCQVDTPKHVIACMCEQLNSKLARA